MVYMSSSKTKRKTRDFSRLKIVLVLGFCFIFWGGLWTRAMFVQIIRGEELSAQANRQYFSHEKITGKRGEIFDREGRVLAQSVRSKSIYANPFLMKDIQASSEELSGILGVEPDFVRSRLERKSSFVWVRRKISDRVAHEVARANMPGVFIIDEHSRVYPRKHMLGQVLGFVGMDNTGLEGLERAFDEHLAGAEMVMVMQRDASGHRFTLMPRKSDRQVDGQDVFLTIDSRIQFIAEQVLAETVEKFQGRHGIAMVFHVPTGDILAWANYPFFNPNSFQQADSSIWRNRAATDLIEPGSTLKPFVIAAALEENLARSDSLYYCEQGRWRVGNNEIRDVRGHEWLTVNRVLRYSSNICTAKMGMELGPAKVHEYLIRLGLSTPTNLPLPGQSRGLLRPYQTWSKIDLATISFGQGMATSFLQLARAYLTLGNDGLYTEPNLLLEQSGASPPGPRVFSSEVSRDVMIMMRDVVERDGTGTRARISGIEVGGKTGTAQKASPRGGYGDKYVASFVGFIPALDPEHMIMVLVDEPGKQQYGGIVAAPAFERIGTRLLASEQGVVLRGMSRLETVQNPESISFTPPRFSISSRQDQAVDTEAVPDLRGLPLRRAAEALLSAGITPSLQGTGVMVHDQSPEPGSPWEQGEKKVILKLSSGF